jgi:D-beta-D-heptose 7-phosphate kinase / D-beta-D-heptose 1-phosphate adenosyltransferase
MKTITPEQIAYISERLHAAGHTIVFTHGIFDLVDPELIHHFREAAKLGSHLIVALQADEAGQRLYGKRALIPLQDRMEVLAAMEMISFVTWFNEETPESLLRSLKPDVVLESRDDISKIIEKIVKLPSTSSS